MQMSFEPITADYQNAYNHKLSRCTQIASDYSFVNVWGWGPEYGLQWAWHDDLVWLRQSIPHEALWAPVGDWSAVDWQKLLPWLGTICDRMIRVPESLLRHLEETLPEVPKMSESRGQWDYLYSRQDLAALSGNRYHKKKNLVNQFKKKYDWTYIPFGPEMVDQALSMQEDWCTWRDCESHDTLAAENKAIARILKHWQHFQNVTGGALRVVDTLVAYTIAEYMPDKSMVIHFEKGNPDFKGSYQAINQMFVETVASRIATVNREQDLDDEGLRKAKLSYHPFDFIKKFEIHLSNQG